MKKIELITAILIALSFSSCLKLVSDDFPDFETVQTVNSVPATGKSEYTYSKTDYCVDINDYVALSHTNAGLELVSYNCWAEQPCSGRAYAICTGN